MVHPGKQAQRGQARLHSSHPGPTFPAELSPQMIPSGPHEKSVHPRKTSAELGAAMKAGFSSRFGKFKGITLSFLKLHPDSFGLMQFAETLLLPRKQQRKDGFLSRIPGRCRTPETFCFSSHRAHGEPEKSQVSCFPGSNTTALEQIPKVAAIGGEERRGFESWEA